MDLQKIPAIVIQAPGRAAIEQVPIPRLRQDYLLVQVHAVALNPTDWKHIDLFPSVGARVGCDYAGVVLEVGDGVKDMFKEGGRRSAIMSPTSFHTRPSQEKNIY
jgi:NADPH:quinone reductase-like Zn-dependent oxidoreductase